MSEALTHDTLTVAEAARLLGVSPSTIRDHISATRLVRDRNKMLSRKAVLELKANIIQNTPSALNRRGIVRAARARELTADEILDLGDDIEDVTKPSSDPHDAMVRQVADRQSKMHELKAKESEARIKRAELAFNKEAGKLVLKEDVFQTTLRAAKEITSMMHNLEFEIAALFPDPEVKAEVRTKVRTVIERCQYQMHKRFEELSAAPDADEELDDDI